MDIIQQYGTLLFQSISAKNRTEHSTKPAGMFNVAMAKVDYNGDYNYAIAPKAPISSICNGGSAQTGSSPGNILGLLYNIMESLYEQGLL